MVKKELQFDDRIVALGEGAPDLTNDPYQQVFHSSFNETERALTLLIGYGRKPMRRVRR